MARFMLGREAEASVGIDEMVLFSRAVANAARRAMVVVDMPWASYQGTRADAVNNARRLALEGGADAVKLEGGLATADTIAAIVAEGVPVMGHIGQLDECGKRAGRLRGSTTEEKRALLADALAVQEAGAFMVGLVLVSPDVAREITDTLAIPTNGIGAGPFCDGQSTLFHAALGFMEGDCPQFLQRYEEGAAMVKRAIGRFIEATRPGDLQTCALPD